MIQLIQGNAHELVVPVAIDCGDAFLALDTLTDAAYTFLDCEQAILFQKTLGAGITVNTDDPERHALVIKIDGADTAALEGHYTHQIDILDANSDRATVHCGPVCVKVPCGGSFNPFEQTGQELQQLEYELSIRLFGESYGIFAVNGTSLYLLDNWIVSKYTTDGTYQNKAVDLFGQLTDPERPRDIEVDDTHIWITTDKAIYQFVADTGAYTGQRTPIVADDHDDENTYITNFGTDFLVLSERLGEVRRYSGGADAGTVFTLGDEVGPDDVPAGIASDGNRIWILYAVSYSYPIIRQYTTDGTYQGQILHGEGKSYPVPNEAWNMTLNNPGGLNYHDGALWFSVDSGAMKFYWVG